MKKLQKRTAPLAAESSEVIGDIVQIGKNVCGTCNMSFKSKGITKQERKALVSKLEKCQNNKPESIQLAYQIAIDFVNMKITKAEYLRRMDFAATQINKCGEYTNHAEEKFVIDFLLHSFITASPKSVKISDIIDSLIKLTI